MVNTPKTWPKAKGGVAASDLNQLHYGGLHGATLAHASVNVGNSNTTIIAANTDRQGLYIRNNGSVTVYVKINGTATTSNSKRLLPDESLFLRDKSAITGITASGTADVRYLEIAIGTSSTGAAAGATGQASMSGTAAAIVSENQYRKRLFLQNIGNVKVFIGKSAVVATANDANGGYPILAGETFDLSDFIGAIYGITASSTSTIDYVDEQFA